MSLETEFKKTLDEYSTLIDAKIAQSRKLLNEAVALSEEHGIPFYAYVSPLGQEYTPRSFNEKWGKLDPEVLEQSGIYINEYREVGWQHSAIC